MQTSKLLFINFFIENATGPKSIPLSNNGNFQITASTSTGIYEKWHMFFKHLLKHYSLNEVGDLLYQGFSYAGLKKEYLDVILQGGHYFLWPQGKTVVSPYHPLPAICPHE